ncbi:CPBP family intramembrane glutamic endopeptidase [Halanaerobaculum tunisiense]
MTKEQEFTILQLLKLQAIWYLINFLIIFCQHYVQFEIPYFNDFYHIIFKVIGRSFFIPYLLYWATIHDLSFRDLGITTNNLWLNLKLGTKISLVLLAGIIIINLSLTTAEINPLVMINDLKDLTTTLLYLPLLVIGYLIPALSKELLYRGIVYHYWRTKLGWTIGLLISNLYYVISYFDFTLGHLIIYLLVGLITTYLYYKTKSLVASVLFQTIYQASLTLYLFSFTNWSF